MMMETILSRSLRLVFAGGAALGIGMLAQPAFAQESTDQATAAPVQRVEITGSSIKRIDGETALPVQVVTSEDIKKLGVTSTEALLSSLSANSTVGGTTTAQGSGSSTYGEATASLRGLGANKTLVLLDGRRLANYATDGTAVDVNSIPLSMIDHVEILKDGASGVYGSDAIGGVINFITRKDFKGVELSATGSGTQNGGGSGEKIGAIVGFGNFAEDNYNFTFSADYSKDKPIYGSQRSYANSSWDQSAAMNYDQSATPSGAIRTYDPSATPGVLNSQGSAIGNPLDGHGVQSASNCAANGSAYDVGFATCRYNSSPAVPLLPEVERATIGMNSHFRLNSDNEFFINAFVSHTVTTVSEQPSPYSVSFLAGDTAFQKLGIYPAIVMNPSSPYYPAAYITAAGGNATQPVTVSYRAFDGGGRDHTDTADQMHLVMGFKGTVFSDYDYDLAYTHNSSNVNESVWGGYQSQTALVKLLSGNNAFNPFTQYQTPALAAQIKDTNYIGNMINSTLYTDSVDGKISGDLFQLPAGVSSFAAGFSVKNENMDFNPSAAYQSGDISGYGAQALPLSAERLSESIFGEISAPIVKHLDADLAVRTDRYPNATSTDPKISLRYQPVQQFLVRAAYGTGFREPALPELYNPQSIATTSTFIDPLNPGAGKNQYNQTTGGNPDLSPEKSKQKSLGIVLQPTKDLSASVDYWNIHVKDLVTTLDPQFIVDQAAAGDAGYTGLVTRDSLGNITNITATNLNAGSEDTAGIDVDIKWKMLKSAEFGTFGARLNGTYTTSFNETLPNGTVQPSVGVTVDANGNPLNAVANGGIIFRWRHELNFDWTKGVYGLTLTQNFQTGYYGNWPSIAGFSDINAPAHVGSLSIWDMQASYTGIEHLTLRAGIKNFLNKQPPEALTLGQYFQTGYDPSYYDPHGRDFYVTGVYKF